MTLLSLIILVKSSEAHSSLPTSVCPTQKWIYTYPCQNYSSAGFAISLRGIPKCTTHKAGKTAPYLLPFSQPSACSVHKKTQNMSKNCLEMIVTLYFNFPSDHRGLRLLLFVKRGNCRSSSASKCFRGILSFSSVLHSPLPIARPNASLSRGKEVFREMKQVPRKVREET